MGCGNSKQLKAFKAASVVGNGGATAEQCSAPPMLTAEVGKLVYAKTSKMLSFDEAGNYVRADGAVVLSCQARSKKFSFAPVHVYRDGDSNVVAGASQTRKQLPPPPSLLFAAVVALSFTAVRAPIARATDRSLAPACCFRPRQLSRRPPPSAPPRRRTLISSSAPRPPSKGRRPPPTRPGSTATRSWRRSTCGRRWTPSAG